MLFAVKCLAHYPGYEVAHAPSVEVLKEQIPTWRSCKADATAITELPEEDEEKYPEELKKKLQGWTDDFTKLH